MKAILRYLVTISLTLAGLWVLGLLVFIAHVQTQERSAAIYTAGQPADGIVVLTGGEGRVAQGLRLLREARGKRLLISGVHPETNKKNILPAQAAADQENRRLLECCTDLGYVAESTVGNAEEAARWAQQQGAQTLVIVTAAYHLPRARLESAQAMPQLTLLYYPLARENVKLATGFWAEPWAIPGTLQLIATEYSKYLFALGRNFSKYLPL